MEVAADERAPRAGGRGASGWRRVTIIVVVFVAILGAVGYAVVRPTWEIGVLLGISVYPYRQLLEKTEPARAPLDLVWLGDSTLTSNPHTPPSYADTMVARVLAPRGVRAAVLACPGLDFFGYYGLLEPVLATHARVVVLTANFRNFAPAGTWTYTDLLGLVPIDELPEVLRLPYDRRGVSALQLVLARAMRWKAVAGAALWAQGVRHALDEAPFRDALGSRSLPLLEYKAMSRALAATLGAYVRPVGADDPVVRMIGATVARATRHGARVVVVITPMPVEALRSNGLYDAAADAERVAAVRRATEAAGGTLLDFHLALPADQFSDLGSHFKEKGEETMLQLTGPAVIGALIEAGVVKANGGGS